ncbi:MAG: ATP-binding protein [Gaiellaceae bacterium]
MAEVPGSATGRGVPFSAYFAVIVAIAVVSALGSVVYVDQQSQHDAKAQARADAKFAARGAADKLGKDIGLLRASVKQLASNPSIAQAATHPAGCTLTFGGPAGPGRDHIDILLPSGAAVCSSRPRGKDGRLPGYAGQAWVRSALGGPLFRAPLTDTATGVPAAMAAVPLQRKVIVAGFFDLTTLAKGVQSVYGGRQAPEFMIVDNTTHKVVSRSTRPASSIGTHVSLAPAGEQRDLDGTRRIYESATIAGTPWTLFVGEDAHRVLAAGSHLRNRELGLVLASLALLLFMTFLVYRRIVGPVRLLSRGIKTTAATGQPVALPVTGPAEARALATEVNALTAAVNAHEAVRQAKDEAERANEAKSRFLAHMSHEIRTPLAAIMGFAELLHRAEDRERERSWSGYVLDGGRHLLALVNELLEISRIEAGKLMLAPAAVDAERAVDDALDLVAPLAANRGVRLEHVQGTRLEQAALVDPLRFKQVLLNLLANAIKYNREDGLVSVSVEADRETVRIGVRDTGEGIAPDRLERLFTPFERLGAEETPVPGSGLGLVVTKGLVEAMGGKLTVASEVGVGTTFTAELPLQAADHVGEPLAAGPATSGSILYVDDAEENLRLVQSVLADLRPGLELRTAGHGLEAAALAEERPPDLLLLDLNLPDISGEEVLRRLRARAETVDVPVLVLSADSTARNIDRLLQSGADAYLTKPLEVPQFLDVVDRLLATR